MIEGRASRAASRGEPSGEMIEGRASRAASRGEPSGEMIEGRASRAASRGEPSPSMSEIVRGRIERVGAELWRASHGRAMLPKLEGAMTTGFEHVRYAVDDGIATLTLHRPDRLKASPRFSRSARRASRSASAQTCPRSFRGGCRGTLRAPPLPPPRRGKGNELQSAAVTGSVDLSPDRRASPRAGSPGAEFSGTCIAVVSGFGLAGPVPSPSGRTY
jgi:hypothetical protein